MSADVTKECQLDLFADRTSAASMRANQLRLWFAAMAYVLLCALRRIGLAHTQFADATCGTIRLKLLKLGALVRISVRRIKFAIASACPWQDRVRTRPYQITECRSLIRTRHRTDNIRITLSNCAAHPPLALVPAMPLPSGFASPQRRQSFRFGAPFSVSSA